MTISQDEKFTNYLKRLSDEKLQALGKEYNFTDPYERLEKIAQKIVDFDYEPAVHYQNQISTLQLRLYSYSQKSHREEIISLLDRALSILRSNPVPVILPREYNEEMVHCILNIQKFSRIDNYLGINRWSLITKEITLRRESLTRGNYINRCVDFLLSADTISDSIYMTEDQIIKQAHIKKYIELSQDCSCCEGKIYFDDVYDKGQILSYIRPTSFHWSGSSPCFIGIEKQNFEYPNVVLDCAFCPCRSVCKN